MGSCCGAGEDAKAAVRARGLWNCVESVCETFESAPALALGAAGLVASFVLVGHGCGGADGMPGTGGGGGGSGANGNSFGVAGEGGSGVVIIRYRHPPKGMLLIVR